MNFKNLNTSLKKREHKLKDGSTIDQYFIKWKGKGHTFNTWEPKSSFRKDSSIYLDELDKPRQPKTYEKMIKKAILNVNARGGTTQNQITTYIKSRFLVKPDVYKKHTSTKIKELVENGDIIKTKKGTYKLKKELSKKRKLNTIVEKTSKKQKLDKKDSKKETKESFVFEENVDEEEEVEEKEKNSKSGYIWQYFDGGWCNYDFNASEAVDQVYDQWKKKSR